MQIICTSLQKNNHSRPHCLNFLQASCSYWQTVSKQWRHCIMNKKISKRTVEEEHTQCFSWKWKAHGTQKKNCFSADYLSECYKQAETPNKNVDSANNVLFRHIINKCIQPSHWWATSRVWIAKGGGDEEGMGFKPPVVVMTLTSSYLVVQPWSDGNRPNSFRI